jgi:hypothetical protein
MTAAKEVSKYNWDLVGVLEVGWDGSDIEPAGECSFLYEFGTRFLHVRG